MSIERRLLEENARLQEGKKLWSDQALALETRIEAALALTNRTTMFRTTREFVDWLLGVRKALRGE